MMIIGKIVNASSHVDYVCQVSGPGEAVRAPEPAEYGFGSFVAIEQAEDACLVGLIANTMLMNPEFGNLGPRLSPEKDLAVFSPDYLAEQVTLVALIVIGAISSNRTVIQGVPVVAADIDAQVRRLSDEEIALFHMSDGRMRLSYLSLLLGMEASPLMPSLLEQLTSELATRFPDQAATLAILRRNLAWRASVLPAG
jgi:hypothetical protein